MKKITNLNFLFWIFLSVLLFVYFLPASVDPLVKIIAGYVFYLFVREVFQHHLIQAEGMNKRINILKNRLARIPHKTSVYLRGHLNRNKKKKTDDHQYI